MPMIRGVATHGEAIARWFVKRTSSKISQTLHSHKAWKQATPNHRSMRGSERQSVTNATLEVNNTKNARHHD